MLIPEHHTALNDFTDNHKTGIIPLTETWIRRSTTPAKLIDFTPPGYSLFSAPRSYTGNPSKPILAGGTAFLIKEPFIQNSAAHHYSSFKYSSITLKFPKAQLTLFTSTDHPLHHHTLNLSLPFLTNSHRFFSTQPPPLTNSSLLATSVFMLTTSAILKQSKFFNSLPVIISLSMFKFLLTDTVTPSISS